MTGLERIRATIRGETVDRPAISFWRHFHDRDRKGATLAHALLEFQQRYTLDFVKVMPPAAFFVEALGAKVAVSSNPLESPQADPLIQDPAGWRSLRPPSQGASPLREEFGCLETLGRHLQATPFIETVFSPLDTAIKLAGADVLQRHLQEAPADVEAGLKTIARGWTSFLKGCMLRGISGVFFATHGADRSRFTAQEFERFGRPYDLEVLSVLERDQFFNVLHLHGERLDLEAAAGYPVQAVNFRCGGTNPGIRDALGAVKVCVATGIQEEGAIATGGPKDVHQEVVKAIEEGGQRRFIVAPGCVLPPWCPSENLDAARAAADVRF